MKIRAGIGYDIHRLEEGRKLFLGGVEIDFPSGLKGHSDGDCLVHAIIDALLGAAGEEDVGHLFPDTDPKYKDVRSTRLLGEVVDRMRQKNIRILNVDAIIIAEKPRLASHIPRMKEALSPILGVTGRDLAIKAKTNEGLGPVGREEAMAAMAQVLVQEE